MEEEVLDLFGNKLEVGDTILISNESNDFKKVVITEIIITPTGNWIKFDLWGSRKKRPNNVVKYIGL